MGMFKCKSCGAAILWITTKAGKMMPCDGKMFYGKTPGTDTLVTRDGQVVRCTVTNDMNAADVSEEAAFNEMASATVGKVEAPEPCG